MPEAKTYRIISCDELTAQLSNNEIVAEKWIDDIDVHIPAISYGQVDRPQMPWWEWPPNSWDVPSYSLRPVKKYILKNAIVHGELGLITIGDFCIKESMHMVFPQAHGFAMPSPNEICLLNEGSLSEVDEGFHALCGYVGNRNYAHWWVDVVPVIGYQVLDNRFGKAVALLPQIRAGYQRQTMDLVPEIRDTAIFINEHERKKINKLQFVPSLTAGDYFPQPANMRFIKWLKANLGISPSQRGSRRVYLSRRDAQARKMLNEDDICDTAMRNGFEVIATSGMPLIDQIYLFSETSHVVSSHGAGLANTIFCFPGSRMLELHAHNAVNWSLRRLAALPPLSYGCIIGHQQPKMSEQTDEDLRQNPWTLDPRLLQEVIASQPFA